MQSVSRICMPQSYTKKIAQDWLPHLAALLGFPTVSSDPRCRPALVACARWLARRLVEIGLEEVRLLSGYGGPPSVYGAWRGARDKPTLLLYGHYDVQAPGDVRKWQTPPFRATLRGQHLYARGASDDKGQLFILLTALESYLKRSGRLPLNIIVWLEGEEEVGSPHLQTVLERERVRLRADAALVCDTEMIAPGRPAIIYGLRGSVSATLELRRSSGELHSGRYGGAVPNPAQALVALLAPLHDERGRIALPGFYRRVRQASNAEREALRAEGLAERRLLAQGGSTSGEAGFSPFEHTTIRPALTIMSLKSGDGAGSIPMQAIAQINIRLVPDQQPEEIVALLQQYVCTHTPRGLHARLTFGGATPPVLLPRQHPATRAAVRAVEQVWGVPPIFTRSGGSIGPVSHFWHTLGMPTVVLGFGDASDNIHAPNERLFLPNFVRGVETIVRLFEQYGSL